jgi:hypothetical protein
MRQSTRHGSAWKVGCPGQVQCGRVNFPFTFGVYAAPVRWSMRPWESVRRASRSAGTATVGWILRGPGFARTVSPGATLLLTPNARTGLPLRSKRACSKPRARAGPVDDRTSRVLPATGRRGKSCDGQTPGPGCRRARSGHARSLVLRPVPAMIRASRVGGGHGPPRKSSPVDGHRPRDWWVHGPSRVEWPDASWNRDGPERDTAESKRPTASC